MRYLSQPQPEIFRHAEAMEAEPRNSPWFQSPVYRPFAWQRAEGDAEQRTARLAHSLLLQPEQWQATGHGSTAVRLHGHPERHRVLQTSVSIERHLSRIFPVFPSVTRVGACPAPLHPNTQRPRAGDPESAARRCSASAYHPSRSKAYLPGPRFCAALRVWVSKQKISLRNMRAAAALAGEIFSSEPPQKAHLGLGSGVPCVASRKSVPRAIRAIQTGEKQWQPTETTSI
jgi:hypothetical protein